MNTSGKYDILRHLRELFSKDDESISANQPLTDYFPAIIYIFDAEQKKYTYVNESRITEWLGYSMDEMKGWGHDYMKLVFKDDLEMVQQELDKYRSLKDDDDYSYKCRLSRKEGDWMYFRTRGTVLRRNDKGDPSSVLFIAEDISENTKMKEEAAALKKLIDDTEDLLDFGSWSWNVKVDRVFWTDGMYKLLGYEKEDVEPSISNDFYIKHIQKADRQAYRDELERAVANRSDFEITYTIITRQKAEKVVSTKGKIVIPENGEVVKVLGITRDITRQVKINRDLVHYKQMILEKEEFLNQGSWETNLQTGTTTWSKGMYRLFGYDPEKDFDSVEITNETHFRHLSDDEAKRSKSDWEKILKEKDNYSREAPIITKNGESRQVESYGKVIRDKNGSVEKVIGTTRDVTRVREYERSLEEKIKELNRSNTELEDFAYVASHDLQEPLRKLTTFSERLQTKFRDLLGKEGTLYLERIAAATENMRILIDNLLEFSRTARSSRHFTKADLSRLLDEVKTDLELKIEESEAEIHADNLPQIEVIPTQIKQLFDNLLNNSIKFKKKDKRCVIHITCEKVTNLEKDLHLLKNTKNYIKIIFRDNGIGFEKEYTEKIFQIFQRLHGKSEYPGSGIGLAICKKIVENHDGVIFAQAAPLKGATFTVILPENQS
jgi:PAS domain S-box-containing protein